MIKDILGVYWFKFGVYVGVVFMLLFMLYWLLGKMFVFGINVKLNGLIVFNVLEYIVNGYGCW